MPDTDYNLMLKYQFTHYSANVFMSLVSLSSNMCFFLALLRAFAHLLYHSGIFLL